MDFLSEWGGTDIYIVNHAGVTVYEFEGEGPFNGIDTVLSTISFDLPDNVENLTLRGANAIDVTGNSRSNRISGNVAVNVLTGGAGNDSLTGGSGSDTYLFRRTDGIDTVTETAGLAGDTEVVRMTDGIAQSEPVIVKQNSDPYLFIDANNYMKVTGEFSQANDGIERLEVSEASISLDQI